MENLTCIDGSLLNELVNCSILDMGRVREHIAMSKRDQVRKLHPYAITPPKPGQRWQTYYKGRDGQRKIVRAQTENELLDKLIPIYLAGTYLDNLTFYGLFEEWLEYKTTVTDSPNTIKRHKQHYNKYFAPSPLNSKQIKQIDELMLEEECNRIVKKHNLTRKEWCNAKTIVNGMYEYAVRKKYLKENLMQKIQILVKFRQVTRKTGKTETFNTEELKDLNRFLEQQYAETGDSSFLAVMVNMLLGLRVGELVALKWSDIVDAKHLHIVREEVRNQTDNSYKVAEHTKTNRDRFVIIVPKAWEILKRIEQENEYIFVRNGERITSIRIATILRKYAHAMGVPLKSSHKMRKTYASTLNANGVPLDCIREMLGHTNLNTTLSYIYNPLTEEETFDLIAGAL